MVVEVASATTLAQAYAAVQTATGFEPMYDVVDETHVAVLRGRTRGLPIDVQVVRAAGDSEAEAQSRASMALTRRLDRGVDARLRLLIDASHRLFERAQLKDHLLCRLPGIGITCVAVVLGCHTFATLRKMLVELHTALASGCAVIDFDAQQVVGAVDRRRVAAQRLSRDTLNVVVGERNVASRMLRATTAHLVDALAFLVSFDEPACADVSAWREQTMFTAVRVRHRSARSVSHQLPSALQKLQAHPVIDALHADACVDAQTIRILCTLRATDIARYAFQPSDALALASDESHAVVKRDGKCYPLCLSVRHRGVQRARSWNLGSAFCVPDVPTLTVDATLCFDAAHWEVVW